MSQFSAYFGRINGLRGEVGGLPGWAKFIVFLAAIPGIALAALSIAIFLISILALLILAAPVYSLLRQLTRSGGITSETIVIDSPAVRRPASAKVIESVSDTDLK